MPPHSDKIANLEKDSWIFDYSFGAERELVFTDSTSGKETMRVPLTNGSLFLLGPATNYYNKHEVPKRHGAGPRISLIFRFAAIKPQKLLVKLRKDHTKQLLARAAKRAAPSSSSSSSSAAGGGGGGGGGEGGMKRKQDKDEEKKKKMKKAKIVTEADSVVVTREL